MTKANFVVAHFYFMEVIKPQLTLKAMCIYKFTLNTGFYYYGATTNLCERISSHLKSYREKRMAKSVMAALENATSIKFEFVKFVNDRKNLKKEEEKYLSRHIGLPKCLNTDIICTSGFKRGEAVFRIAKMDTTGGIIKIYDSPSIAAKDLGISRLNVQSATSIQYPRTKYILRKLKKDGSITVPIKPYKECPSLRKPVYQYDKQMNFIAKHESIMAAARIICADRKGIASVVNGLQKTCKGYKFKYAG